MTSTDHRFRDEWLVRVVSHLPGLTPVQIANWRVEKRPYLSQAVLEAGLSEFEKLADAVRSAFRIDSVPLTEPPSDKAVMALVPEKLMRKHQILPVRADARRLDLAMMNPLDGDAIQAAEWASNRKVVPLFCRPDRLDELLRDALSSDAVIHNLLERIESSATVEVIGSSKEDQITTEQSEVRAPVIQLVNAIISNAVTRRASDIHIEHDDNSSAVRYRIDGLLRNVMVLPRYLGVGPVVSRIKIMAQLDVSDRLRPQDGRAKLRVGGEEIGLRVSTLPTRVGEKVVMRILNERAVQGSLESLGFAPALLERLLELVSRKQGIVLVTGPTGSGKTTTLYAALNARRAEAVNIVTVEDPVEYKLVGINQVQVNEKQGLTFASVLRSVLRQDPDVVLVGEIRDQETAAVAIQAAMTGHLVMSTLHTNDSVGAVARLRDMGVEPFRIGAALLGVTAQRLVRRVCRHCAVEAPLDALDDELRAALEASKLPKRHVKAVGCQQCGFAGYAGRFPVTELLVVTTEMRDTIVNGASAEELRAKAESRGALHTMEADSLYHLAHGNTTQEEVLPHLEGSRLKSMAGAGSASSAGADAAASAASAGTSSTTDSSSAARKPVILVAVGDTGRRDAIAAAIRATNADVHVAADGPTAIATAARVQPNLLIADLELTGLDGLQVMRMAGAGLGLDLATILLVAESQATRHGDLLTNGASDVVVLPASADDIRDRARSALLRKAGWSDTADVMRAPTPANEAARLDAVRKTKMLDTPAEERFDKLTRTAQRMFNVPIALVTLIDEKRQWFKSRQGLSDLEIDRTVSFCDHAIHSSDVMVVPDTMLDPRFAENPLVTGESGYRFYAGYPISGEQGFKIGTLCIIDRQPRDLTDDDREALKDLGALVESEIGRR